MAANGASGIKGGNFLIFEQFLNRSGANVYLNTPVSSFAAKSGEQSQLWSVKSARGTVDYKSVILAAPFHSTGIKFPSSLVEQIPAQPYVHLHVTLLTTTSPSPNPEYFGLPASTQVPRMILTTNETARAGGAKLDFNSLTYHGLVREGEWAVKIFSDHEITDGWLDNMFQGKVGWVLRKQVSSFTIKSTRSYSSTLNSGTRTPSFLPQPNSLQSNSIRDSTTSTPLNRKCKS